MTTHIHIHTLTQLKRWVHAPVCNGGRSWLRRRATRCNNNHFATCISWHSHSYTVCFSYCLAFGVWSLHKQLQQLLVLNFRRQTVQVLCLVQFVVHWNCQLEWIRSYKHTSQTHWETQTLTHTHMNTYTRKISIAKKVL